MMILFEVSMCIVENLLEDELPISRITMVIDNTFRLYRGQVLSRVWLSLILEESGVVTTGKSEISPAILRSSGNGAVGGLKISLAALEGSENNMIIKM